MLSKENRIPPQNEVKIKGIQRFFSLLNLTTYDSIDTL